MTQQPIKLWPEPCLSVHCDDAEVSDTRLVGLIEDLFDTMYAAPGRGLAAPQIGVLKRVFVVDLDWKTGAPNPMAFVNPVITGQSVERSITTEQCLSIPETPMPVERPDKIDLSWTTVDGEAKSATFTGDLARCIQHEFDHLNGTVIFDHQSPEQRAVLEADYGA